MKAHTCRTDIPVLLLFDIDPSWSDEDIEDSFISTRLLARDLRKIGHLVAEEPVMSKNWSSILARYPRMEWLVFNWCEELPGVPHSAGFPPRVLAKKGFTFTGSTAKALNLNQDKVRTRRRLETSHIVCPVWEVYTSSYSDGWDIFPAIVKPAHEHCSLGISRDSVVFTPGELKNRVQLVIDTYRQPALVEEFIDGREITVSILGNDPPKVLPPAEIDFSGLTDPHDRLRTYEAKFDPASSAFDKDRLILHADLSFMERRSLSYMVLSAYKMLRCRDYARMDLRLRDGKFYLVDVNLNPDISRDASLPRSAAAYGLSYGRLGSLLVNLAARRHPVFRTKQKILDNRERSKNSWQELLESPAGVSIN
jgi:D-alanine-D-alanine ligase